MPGLYRQTKPERLDRIGIPLGWVRSVESLRAYGRNLTMLLGTSGTGRDSLLEAIQTLEPSYARIRRTTTRANRSETEQGRIISLDRFSFTQNAERNKLVSLHRYPANNQLYGVSIEELTKLTQQKGILEGTTELLPLKILFPESKVFVVLPESLEQVRAQIIGRDGNSDESRRRFNQTIRELSSLVSRLPHLTDQELVDGIIVNAPPFEKATETALGLLRGNQPDFSLPQQLSLDITTYLETWR